MAENTVSSVFNLVHQYCGDNFDLIDKDDGDEDAKRTIRMSIDDCGNFNAGIATTLVRDRLYGMVHTGCNLMKPDQSQRWSAVPIGVQLELRL